MDGTGAGVGTTGSGLNAQGYNPALVDVPPGTPGAGNGLWGWSDLFGDLRSTDPLKRQTAYERLWLLGSGQSLLNQFAALDAQKQENQLKYTTAIAGNRVPPTSAPGSSPAQVRGWNPALITQIIEMVARAGRGN